MNEHTRFPEDNPDLRFIHGHAAHMLGRAIVAGEYAPGRRLPTEMESAEQLGISRSSYREATRILTGKGLLISRPRTGTVVNARSAWNMLDPDILAWMFQAAPVCDDLIRDLFELRMVVEPAAAGLAARRRTAEQLELMTAALGVMRERTLASEAGLAADKQFHTLILEATGNATFMSLANGIGAAARWATIFKNQERELPRDPIPDHQRLLDAIAAQDPDAARHAASTLLLLAQEDAMMAISPPALHP
ncbi:galactonate operon transcriptional repressor [Asticcacaulis biprosthecium C19]|uniref:Galactonate operon transcriptional repressor n=1 Tax=Asticcacaulis biprosthecium C19 TaxID=715226 RepID=F4QI92_9CAUL|nr:FadR/GntR family transcriptional regulator [Asticcacaulis biprosthecium]EGF91730.1 galactonate operon transcriptional repressor [Asticcacaulis biprosthecium C19]